MFLSAKSRLQPKNLSIEYVFPFATIYAQLLSTFSIDIIRELAGQQILSFFVSNSIPDTLLVKNQENVSNFQRGSRISDLSTLQNSMNLFKIKSLRKSGLIRVSLRQRKKGVEQMGLVKKQQERAVPPRPTPSPIFKKFFIINILMQKSILKIAFTGPPSSGKTSVVHRLLYDSLPLDIKSTIGLEFSSIQLLNCSVHIWDTSGQEKYRGSRTLCFRKADLIIIVYDLSISFQMQGISAFLRDIRDYNQNAKIILVGNKLQIKKPLQNSTQFVLLNQLTHLQLSAVTSSGFQNFKKAIEDALNHRWLQCVKSEREEGCFCC